MASTNFGTQVARFQNLPSFDPSKQKSISSPNVRRFENISDKRLILKNMEAKLPEEYIA